jgi:hypothetical protein
MSQAWLQVAGLLLDMLGVLLVAGEWLIAQAQERRALDIEAGRQRHDDSLERFKRIPNAQPAMLEHMERVASMQRQVAQSRLGEARVYYGRRRYAVIYVGLGCVVLGFALQLMGAWPGCCAWAGIAPQ